MFLSRSISGTFITRGREKWSHVSGGILKFYIICVFYEGRGARREMYYTWSVL